MKSSLMYMYVGCNVIEVDSNPSGATGGNVYFRIWRFALVVPRNALGLLMH